VKTMHVSEHALSPTSHAPSPMPQAPGPTDLETELERLAQENADLRGSARIWIRMYEQLLGYYAELSACGSGRS
jgi:hypothetical protein